MVSRKLWRVTAPYIVVKTGTQDGPRYVGLHTGAILPPDVDQATIDHHISTGQIEEFKTVEVPLEDQASAAAEQVKAAEAALEAARAQKDAADAEVTKAAAAEARRQATAKQEAKPAVGRQSAGAKQG